MQEVKQALDEVKELYQKILGRPAPDLEPGAFVSFPPGVDPIDHAVQEVRFLKQLSEQVALAPRPVAWVPLADCFASKGEYVLRLEVPGIPRDDLNIFITGGECVVRGERKQPETFIGMRPLIVEQSWGPFERRFPLPAGVVADKVVAHYENGVLEIHIDVKEQEIPRETKIDVS